MLWEKVPRSYDLELQIIGPKKIYRTKKFKSYLLNEVRKEDFANNDNGFEKFGSFEQVPRKKIFARSNQIALMSKNLSKK